jgi:hypothetical protein
VSRTTRLTSTLAALVLTTVTAAGCAATTAPSQGTAGNHTSEPSITPTGAETVADGCTDPAWIAFGPMSARMTGEIVDRGARDLAAGTVGLDEDGDIVSYTVAPGDVEAVIGERLCIANAIFLATLNHTRTIHPDQVLRLTPNPAVPWIPYDQPDDAPAGFQQIPYQRAIEAMGTAADAGDVDSMRAIWTDELSAMFVDQADIDVIQWALDKGDLDVLRQMFS